MSADRELLELAAKAAGMEPPLFWEDGSPIYPWNPLKNDGDALRLAVKLGLAIQHGGCYVVVYTGQSTMAAQFVERHEKDPYPATRLAITRAAAKIGRAMP
jgi:hypothetical protein